MLEQYTIELTLAALFAISELVALSPLKSNSIFQMVYSILKLIKSLRKKKLEQKEEEK